MDTRGEVITQSLTLTIGVKEISKSFPLCPLSNLFIRTRGSQSIFDISLPKNPSQPVTFSLDPRGFWLQNNSGILLRRETTTSAPPPLPRGTVARSTRKALSPLPGESLTLVLELATSCSSVTKSFQKERPGKPYPIPR